MFSNLKWSWVFSSSWTSTTIWCQQNWAEVCGLQFAAAVESQLLAGCGWAVQGRPQCKAAICLAPGLRPCLKWKRQLLYPVPSCTSCSILRLGWRQNTINIEVGKDLSWLLLGQIASIVGGRKRKSKLCSWTEKQAAAGKEKKVTLLPHVPLACDQLRQLLIVYRPGKKCSVV